MPTAACHQCAKTIAAKPTKDGAGLKTPLGWRKLGEELLCGACVRTRYYTRGFRVAIGGVAPGEERDAAALRAALSAAAKATARFANWYIQRLYAADLAAAPTLATTKDGKTKLPPCPEIDFYRAATAAFPEIAPASIVAVAKMVRGWYAADRFAALVALNRSVRNFRFGELPVEVPKQAWRLLRDDGGKYVIRCQVGPGKSWPVAVYADRYALPRLAALESGAAVALGLKIVRASRAPIEGGGDKPRKSWYFRISAMFPRTAPRQSHVERTLTLGHDPGALLFGALEEGDDVFEYAGESLRQIIVGGDKSERRWQEQAAGQQSQWPRRKRRRWAKDRTRASENRQRKATQQVKLAAAAVVRWCVDRGVTSVDYDATDRGYLPHAPWRALRDAIHSALEAQGIALHVVNEPSEDIEALARPGSETDARV